MSYILGRAEQLWMKSEAAFDVAPGNGSTAAFAAGDAAKVLALSLEPEFDVRPRDDKADTGSAREPIALRRGGSWTLRARMIPSGAAGTAPDLGAAFAAGYGAETASGSQVSYGLAKNKTASLSLLRKVGAVSELATGCVVDTVKVSAAGDDLAEVEFGGRFASLVRTAQVTVPGGASDSATSFAISAGDCLQPGSLITVGSEDIRVNTMSGNVITDCERGWHGTTPAAIASGAAAVPYAPSAQTTAGSPSVGVSGSLSLNGVTHKVISLEHMLKNNLTLHDNHFGTDRADGFSDGKQREVMFTLEARVDALLVGAMNRGDAVRATEIECVLGAGEGKTWTFSYPNAVGKVAAIRVPEFEEATARIEFRAYRSAADEDEHELTVN